MTDRPSKFIKGQRPEFVMPKINEGTRMISLGKRWTPTEADVDRAIRKLEAGGQPSGFVDE